MVRFDKPPTDQPHEHERVLVARAWQERAGFRARLTMADLTQPESRRTSVVVSSPDEVLRVVQDWLQAYEDRRHEPRLRRITRAFRRRRG